LFGDSTQSRTVAGGDTMAGATTMSGSANGTADLLREAQQHYDRAIAAQRAGDWATYGREIDQLGALLKGLPSKR
jgi:uncharacterized membrane protein (UPF0182 family)